MEIASLGSGSSGNATLVRGQDTCILVDNGFTIKETVRRLQQVGLQPEDLHAIVVTHEHSDHINGVGPFSRRFNTPVYMTHGTYHAARDKKLPILELFHAHNSFSIGDITLEPFPTPHDAAESCQFVFSSEGQRIATLTDLGSTTKLIKDKLQQLDGLVLECNYDAEMLRLGPYGEYLQARIRGNYGHLDNVQAAHFLQQIDFPGLQQILVAHLSEKNNHPQKVLTTLEAICPDAVARSVILQQQAVSGWVSLA